MFSLFVFVGDKSVEGLELTKLMTDGGWFDRSAVWFGVFARSGSDCSVDRAGHAHRLFLLRSEIDGAKIQLERGRILIDRMTGQTSNPKFFAGGDCTNGGREVVDAVADGKRAGIGIAAWLEAQHVQV